MRVEDDKETAKKRIGEKEPHVAAPALDFMTITSGHKRVASLDASALRTMEEGDRQRPHPRVSDSPRTPDQPIHPEDPNYTGSSIDSGATAESKDEEYTKQLISDMLRDTMTVLENGFVDILWQNSGYDAHLCMTFFPFIRF